MIAYIIHWNGNIVENHFIIFNDSTQKIYAILKLKTNRLGTIHRTKPPFTQTDPNVRLCIIFAI